MDVRMWVQSQEAQRCGTWRVQVGSAWGLCYSVAHNSCVSVFLLHGTISITRMWFSYLFPSVYYVTDMWYISTAGKSIFLPLNLFFYSTGLWWQYLIVYWILFEFYFEFFLRIFLCWNCRNDLIVNLNQEIKGRCVVYKSRILLFKLACSVFICV